MSPSFQPLVLTKCWSISVNLKKIIPQPITLLHLQASQTNNQTHHHGLSSDNKCQKYFNKHNRTLICKTHPCLGKKYYTFRTLGANTHTFPEIRRLLDPPSLHTSNQLTFSSNLTLKTGTTTNLTQSEYIESLYRFASITQ